MQRDIYDDDQMNDENVSIGDALMDNEEDAERLLGVNIDSDDDYDPSDLDGDGDPDSLEIPN
ncbi:MAG: hypothetical protein LBT91_02180 [Bifidobacteriaceae bacterium]|jgi:hypothetical protein|nr:hypothetical protein [Bifidobacteriaceae bacterium]